ncbi:PUA-like domain-containing protein [Cercophora newfieldiana]|uniref:PUA-like domain-containing protein n=1 Tax=Cercophora newfieldiana TaxID=92897 RepID=A0AA39XVI7_9PEZI|nr:PUA-like domain-containing protein [Cercophora newfieldiana]
MAPPPPSESAISPSRPDILAFMSLASTRLGTPLPAPKDIFDFGHGGPPSRTNLFLGRAIRGEKTATTSWPLPSPLYWGPGDLSVILDGEGKPAAVMRTLSFVQCMFKDVEEGFALAEAEGDYEEYRKGHKEFYGKQEGGEDFGEESMVLCERFEVIFPRREDEEGKRWWEGVEE